MTGDFSIVVRSDGRVDVAVATDGRRVDVILRNAGGEPVHLDRVEIETGLRPDRVLEHGYQSWSVVRRTRPSDVRPERAQLPDWVRGTHFSDPGAAGRLVSGDHFLVTDAGVVGFLDARSHLGTIEARADGSVVAVALLDGVLLDPGAERRLDPLWIGEGDSAGPLYSAFAAAWGATAGARIPEGSVAGWCSWYQYFDRVTPDDIRDNLDLAVRHGIDLVQIDDGYQHAIGDWLRTSTTWPDGTAAMAGEIRARDARAGIWTAPFLVGQNSDLFERHPHWVPVHSSGHPSKAMFNPEWGGWALVLDTTRPEVLAHLRATYAALTAQGFDYHKIDFCYAAALPAARFDQTKTRAESIRQGIEAVRDGIGDDAFLLGCGCPFGPAVGLVDAMRVSADVAPVWEPVRSWPGLAETAPSAANAIMASVLRAPLHRRLFLNDPDCLLIRPEETNLDERQRDLLADVIAGTGAFLLLSDDLALYTDREWAIVENIRFRQPELDTVLDIDDPFADPVVVRSANGTTLEVAILD